MTTGHFTRRAGVGKRAIPVADERTGSLSYTLDPSSHALGRLPMNGDLASLYKSSIVSQLDKLHRELLELVDPLTEAQFWIKPLDPGNSVGHLILHLTGNLNWFVGANL